MSDTKAQVPSPPPPSAQSAATAADTPSTRRRLRLWPGVVIVVLEWLLITVPGWVAPGTMSQFMAMFWGPLIATLAFLVWWLFFSRLPWRDRWLGLGVCAAAAAVLAPFYHESVGFMTLAIYALPRVAAAWVLWLLIARTFPKPVWRVGMLAVFLLVWGYFALIRLEGVTGGMAATFHFRWKPTAEEQFLASRAAKPADVPASPAASAAVPTLAPGDWPGFRGPNRDSRLAGVRIATDWQREPPRQLWRQRIGPGWSSFAVVGQRLYTQEQRGEEEAVTCYDAGTGAELWAHGDAARFTEVVSGPGPRATPTFYEGKVYTLGATGRLNCLDAVNGEPVWSRDIAADSGATTPIWGFSASPLILQGVVTVFAGGPEGKSVLGYDAASGDLRWSTGEGQHSYCSLQPARLGGVEQLLIATDAGLTSFDPVSGDVLWRYSWPIDGMARIVQPAVLDDSDVLVGTGFSFGTRRVRVGRDGDGWTTEEVWPTRAIKPYYNDLVVHRGHAWGFDGVFFVCINLDDGKGKWRARGYGNGQVLLLADQDLLLILSEQGEVALAAANPDKHQELARFPAIEGKTWNHPVIAHGRLFVRNSEEAACFQLVETDAASEADPSGGDEGPRNAAESPDSE